ncbi:hypothetical protein K439DRAFT_883633 [Ramaria rubella]|nr:hypothetical protein K439DRAFT_883633 [Ramaria rubella]
MEDESKSDESKSDSLLSRDPFRAPVVVTKRWSDYDDDDQSLGSPMSIPITPDSSLDIPELDLSGSANQLPVKSRTNPRRPATILIAIPTLVNYSPWFFISKTILPVPRISILTSEDYPRSCQTASLHPMKLQSSTYKPLPGSTGKQRMRMRLEHWVREDVEKNLKAKLALSSTEKKKAEAEAEAFIYNRMSAVAGIHTGETLYFGEPDILGTKVGICVDDVREIVTGRFRGEKDSVEQSKVILIPSAEGWICKRLGELQS